MPSRSLLAAVLLAQCFAIPASAQTPSPTAVPAGLPLAQQVEAALAAPALRNASVGICIRSVDSGEIIYARNADLALMPASNEKLLTATAALNTLGVGFMYQTSVRTSAAIDAHGAIHGDLYLVGSGDPSMGDAQIAALAKALFTGGLRAVTGRIVADATAFDDKPLGEGWEWDDETYDYAAQVSALNCNENVVQIAVAPGATPGAPASVTVNDSPTAEEPYVDIANHVVTTATVPAATAQVSFTRQRGTNHIDISGSVPIGARPAAASITIENPAKFSATRLLGALRTAGIAVSGVTGVDAGPAPADSKSLATVASRPLADLMVSFLKESDNLYGEALLKTMGRAANPSAPGSATTGATAIEAMLKQYDVPDDGLLTADGSGLSRRDTVTAGLICSLLVCVDKRIPSDMRTALINALPIAGVDGTLRRRFAGTPLAGKVRGKTGTLAGVSALSGYIDTRNGKRYAFSILMNNFSRNGGEAAAHGAQDRIVRAIDEQ